MAGTSHAWMAVDYDENDNTFKLRYLFISHSSKGKSLEFIVTIWTPGGPKNGEKSTISCEPDQTPEPEGKGSFNYSLDISKDKDLFQFDEKSLPERIEIELKGSEMEKRLSKLHYQLGVPRNAPSLTDLESGSPQLIRALNSVADKPSAEPFAPDGTFVVKVLNFIYGRLTDDLKTVWQYPEGRSDRWGWKNSNGELNGQEDWARAIAELLTAVPYHGPGQNYLSGSHEDHVVLRKMYDQDDPAIPVMGACQQLCSIAAISQGLAGKGPNGELSDITIGTEADSLKTNGLTAAGTNSALPIFKGDGCFKSEKANQGAASALKAGARQGSSFGGYLKTNDGPSPHIAFVVRANPAFETLQFFDTGGLNIQDRPDKPLALALQPDFRTIREYQFTESISFGHSFNGMGVLPPKGDATLQTCATALRKMRPLGLARLLLARSPEAANSGSSHSASTPVEFGDLLYISPLLCMYEPKQGSIHNFYASKLLWSLRGLPGFERLRAFWSVFVPDQTWSNAVLDKGGEVLVKATRHFGQDLVTQFVRLKGCETDARPGLSQIIQKANISTGSLQLRALQELRNAREMTLLAWARAAIPPNPRGTSSTVKLAFQKGESVKSDMGQEISTFLSSLPWKDDFEGNLLKTQEGHLKLKSRPNFPIYFKGE